MTPTFEQIVEWLKSVDVEQPFPQQYARPTTASAAPAAKEPEGSAAMPASSAASAAGGSGHTAKPDTEKHPLMVELTEERLVQGIILSEILGRPVSRRGGGRFGRR
jgi:hypothetical protein